MIAADDTNRLTYLIMVSGMISAIRGKAMRMAMQTIMANQNGTINSARDGGEQVKSVAHVRYWDTLTLSGGQRFQVMAAALASKANWAMLSIQDRLGKIRERSEVIYTLDTLEYLARGGRIGRVKAMAGALLNLKPVIRVDSDGKYTTVTTARTLSKSINAITEHLNNRYGQTPVWITVLHGRFAEKAESLASELKSRMNIAKLEVARISPVLGVHTGPGIVGAAVVPLEFMEDLI